MRAIKLCLLSVFAVFLFLGIARPAHAAFGVSPPFLNADHLVPGVTYTQTIYLVQDQPNADLPIKASLTLPQPAVSWITIDKGFDFAIPKGTRQFPVVISVHIPEGQGLAKYTGDLSFTSAPSQAGQVTIALGVDVVINLTVGSGIYEQYSVPLITLPDIEEGWNPKAYVKFQNDGNIPEGFDSATFDIYDQYDAVRLAYITKNDGFPATGPFSKQEYALEFPTDFHLGIGQYWGVVTFYKNQKVIATQKTIFNVLKAGSIAGSWGIITRYLGKNILLIVLAGIIVVTFIAFMIVRRARRRRAHSTA